MSFSKYAPPIENNLPIFKPCNLPDFEIANCGFVGDTLEGRALLAAFEKDLSDYMREQRSYLPRYNIPLD